MLQTIFYAENHKVYEWPKNQRYSNTLWMNTCLYRYKKEEKAIDAE